MGRRTAIAIAVTLTLWAGTAQAVCVFFEHVGFRGRAFALAPGECAVLVRTGWGARPCGGYRPVDVGEGFNDAISSVIVADGAAAFAWEHVDGPVNPRGGWLRYVGRSAADLTAPAQGWNDGASVLRCWAPPGLAPPR